MWLLGWWEVGGCSAQKEKALKPQNSKELGCEGVCVLGGGVVLTLKNQVLESKGERNRVWK